MEPKRSDSFGERVVDDIERDSGAIRSDVGSRGGDTVHPTLAPGEAVTVVPPGEAEVVNVTGGGRSSGQTTVGGGASVVGGSGAGAAVGSGFAGGELRSMSTDNTSAGRTGDIANTGPIDLAVTGMRVVDANGDELGKVDDVKMGDPSAVTTQGEEYDDGDLIDDIGQAVFGGSDLPDQIRHNLIRVGYLRIDGKGWFDTDYFAAADQIQRVEGDTVHLSVAKEALPTV
jgi:hypothetical protein